jgi:Flp pilus assembly protein CpaB
MRAAQAASHIVEDATMKPNRIVTLLAAVLIAGIVTWAFAREHVGAQEVQSIEAAAP